VKVQLLVAFAILELPARSFCRCEKKHERRQIKSSVKFGTLLALAAVSFQGNLRASEKESKVVKWFGDKELQGRLPLQCSEPGRG